MITLGDKVLQPGQILFQDLNTQHQDMVMGVCIHAIREVEGTDPTDAMLRAHLVKRLPGHGRYAEFLWKGKVLIRVHWAETVHDTPDMVVRRQKIEQLYRKRIGAV